MRLPNSFTSVTTVSKVFALVIFGTLPFLGFYLGSTFQKNLCLKYRYDCPELSSPDTEDDTQNAQSSGDTSDGTSSEENLSEENTSETSPINWSDIEYTFDIPDGWTINDNPQTGNFNHGSVTISLSPGNNTYDIVLKTVDREYTWSDALRVTAVPNSKPLEQWVEEDMSEGLAVGMATFTPQVSPNGTTYYEHILKDCWDACGYEPITLIEYYFIPEGETNYTFGIMVYGYNDEALKSTIFSIMDSFEKI
jgi:hypothetical protein